MRLHFPALSRAARGAGIAILLGAAVIACRDAVRIRQLPSSASSATVIAGGGAFLVAGGHTDTLAVMVFDASGTPMTGTAVTWSASDGMLTHRIGITDAQGIARAIYRSGSRTGAVTITAEVAGLAPMSMGEYITPAAPARLIAASNTHHTMALGETRTFAAMQVVDAYGNPVPNVTVMALLHHASQHDDLTSPSLTSDADGLIYETFVPGGGAGERELVFVTLDGTLSLRCTIDVQAELPGRVQAATKTEATTSATTSATTADKVALTTRAGS